MEKKNFRVGSKKWDGRMIVNRHTFFGPILFGLLHLFHLALLGQEKKYSCLTCVSGSLPKTNRISRSA